MWITEMIVSRVNKKLVVQEAVEQQVKKQIKKQFKK
jgi:hypothetical protein